MKKCTGKWYIYPILQPRFYLGSSANWVHTLPTKCELKKEHDDLRHWMLMDPNFRPRKWINGCGCPLLDLLSGSEWSHMAFVFGANSDGSSVDLGLRGTPIFLTNSPQQIPHKTPFTGLRLVARMMIPHRSFNGVRENRHPVTRSPVAGTAGSSSQFQIDESPSIPMEHHWNHYIITTLNHHRSLVLHMISHLFNLPTTYGIKSLQHSISYLISISISISISTSYPWNIPCFHV